mmetsp:Transcript_98082/g.299850  ORF Transcript_98082/g.299850 Transcript_98082/m.299850 type:complete len:346 (+) Transcript_98082:6210-7247(+)
MLFIVDINVIVFPLPGGPLRMKGRRSSNHAANVAVCRTVSTVEMINDVSATFSGSMSSTGTRLFQWYHSPSSTRTSKSNKVVSPPRPSGSAMSPPTTSARSAQYCMRRVRCASPAKDQQMANNRYLGMNFSTISSANGKSSWLSSYSRTMLMPLRSSEKRLVSALIAVNTMMWSIFPASAKSFMQRPSFSNKGLSNSTHWAFRFSSLDKPSSSCGAPTFDCAFRSKSPSLILFSSWEHNISGNTTSSANHTIPQRETVANVAYLSVSTSNMIRTCGGIAKRSPLGRVSILLSSKTEFKFSAHSGSTSPSNIIHCRRSFCPRVETRRKMSVNTPSVHSKVVLSNLP